MRGQTIAKRWSSRRSDRGDTSSSCPSITRNKQRYYLRTSARVLRRPYWIYCDVDHNPTRIASCPTRMNICPTVHSPAATQSRRKQSDLRTTCKFKRDQIRFRPATLTQNEWRVLLKCRSAPKGRSVPRCDVKFASLRIKFGYPNRQLFNDGVICY